MESRSSLGRSLKGSTNRELSGASGPPTFIGGEPRYMHANKRPKGGKGHTPQIPVLSLVSIDVHDNRRFARRSSPTSGQDSAQGNRKPGRASRDHPSHGLGNGLQGAWPTGRSARHGQSQGWRVCEERCWHERRRELLQPTEAVDRRHLPSRQPRAPAPVPGRIRLPLLDVQDERWRAATENGRPVRRETAYLSATQRPITS